MERKSQKFLPCSSCSASAASTNALIIGRLICGVGIGLSSTLVPLYISEVSASLLSGEQQKSYLKSFPCISVCSREPLVVASLFLLSSIRPQVYRGFEGVNTAS